MPLQHAASHGRLVRCAGRACPARAGCSRPADDHAGAPDVVVLSSRLAERLFGSVTGAIGRRVRLQETTFTVVGVAPAG